MTLCFLPEGPVPATRARRRSNIDHHLYARIERVLSASRPVMGYRRGSARPQDDDGVTVPRRRYISALRLSIRPRLSVRPVLLAGPVSQRRSPPLERKRGHRERSGMHHHHSNRLRQLPRPLCFAALVCSACNDDDTTRVAVAMPDRFREFALAFDSERERSASPVRRLPSSSTVSSRSRRALARKGVASEAPVGARTIFRTGSMGKVVTAIGVMSADGLLELDALLRDAIPDVSLAGPEVAELTLRLLLSQQTGLTDYLTIQGPSDDAGLAEFTSGSELADNVQFMNPPGLFWN